MLSLIWTLGIIDWIALIIAGVGAWYFLIRKKTPEYDFGGSSALIKPISPNINGDSGTEGLSLANSNSFVAKMNVTGRHVVVFYGSQTGTAEDLANRLAKDAQRYGMKKGFALDPEECDMEELVRLTELKNPLVIFCLATYGEGDPTDNAQDLNEYLQRGDVDLHGINYAVFGLGNKTYEHYNAMAKSADKRLAELGAHRILELGLGDDDGNLEEDFLMWRENFWPAVCDHFGIKTIGEEINTRQYRLIEHSDPSSLTTIFAGEMYKFCSFNNPRPPYDAKNPYLSFVKVNEELHTGGERSCRHIEFDIKNSKIRYDAGDHVGIFPSNDSRLVEKFGEILNVDLDKIISLVNLDEDSTKKNPFCCPCSYRTALTHYVDIVTPVRTNVLKELAEYCSNQDDKQFLLSMTSTKEESRKKFNEWIGQSHRTALDILIDVPSCRPPLDHILELLPRLQMRYYSISSSFKFDPSVISITAVVVQYTSKIGRQVDGVATSYLAKQKACLLSKENDTLPCESTNNSSSQLVDGNGSVENDKKTSNKNKDRVPIFVRKSQLRLPRDPKVPIIMIGPGTGLAPFRGFLQEREYLQKSGVPISEATLYFGCRNRAHDFLYQDQLQNWLKSQVLTELHVAPSRESSDGKKVYVQHLLAQNAESTWRMINSGAHVYVCGDAKNMSKDVLETFHDILMNTGRMNRDDALAYVKKMESQKRYQVDVWS